MVSNKSLQLLNFLGAKRSRRYIVICVRCGSENIQRGENFIKCRDCSKVLSIKSQA